MEHRLLIIFKKAQATRILEYLNTYDDVKYKYTSSEFFGDSDVAAVLVVGNQESIDVIPNYIHGVFSTDAAVVLKFVGGNHDQEHQRSLLQ